MPDQIRSKASNRFGYWETIVLRHTRRKSCFAGAEQSQGDVSPKPCKQNLDFGVLRHAVDVRSDHHRCLSHNSTIIHRCAKVKDEVEKLAYQLNEEAERTERPIRRLSKVMYGSTCADMQVDVMGECLSSIKHVVGTTSRCFYPRSNHWEVGGRPQCDKCGCRVRNCSQHRFTDFGDNFKLQEQLSGGSVVVVHEEPHPQMTGTLSYRPEETGGRQREKSPDTRHRRLDDRYRVLPWPEDCTVVVCLHDALYRVTLTPRPSEKAFSVVPGTPELERQ
ncbi:uncharacterized protein TNCV_3279551 [Trichonephila clavipes]|nr:uncharacterized protein TNCV_3279551 [Trichonephila clavipes]